MSTDKNQPQPQPEPQPQAENTAASRPETVAAVRKFIERLGGVDQAREALETLKKLRDDAA